MIEFSKSPALRAIKEELTEGKNLLIDRIWQTPKAAILAQLIQLQRNVLVLTSSSAEDALFEDLRYFGIDVFELPSWETLPGEDIAPSVDIVGKRMQTLSSILHSSKPKLILAPMQSALQKLIPEKNLETKFLRLKKGQTTPFEQLPATLEKLGYKRCPTVTDKGQYALRGGIIDIYPPSATDPYRVEFFGNEIEEIRSFDSIGQKSIEKVSSFECTAVSELDLLQESSELSDIFSYLNHPLVVLEDLSKLEDAASTLKNMPGIQSKLFFSFEEFFAILQKEQKLFFCKEPIAELSKTQKNAQGMQFEFFLHQWSAKHLSHPFRKLEDFLDIDQSAESLFSLLSNASDLRLQLVFLSSSEKKQEDLKKKLEENQVHLPEKTQFLTGYLSSSFVIADLHIGVVAESEFTKTSRIRRQKWRGTYHTPASEFHELQPGDLVVHFHSGIGKYLGIEKKKNHLGYEVEFLTIEYANHSKLFVPISQAHLVSRYIGATETSTPALSNLGSKRWQQTKAHAQKQIIGYASDLLKHAAEREVEGGFRYSPDSKEMLEFEEDFPYVATQDQVNAVFEIKQDMMSEKPMDRLICGDVGYGKTEVAMRAAFKAVVDGGKQVAVLVPTTVLATQHFETFVERMRGYPIIIDVLSRNSTPKEQKKTIQAAKEGNVDIVIGTHRILSKDLNFKDLGLIIIDEEQRFGVRAKEHLKKIKKGVDCLTLSATPIPRTLYMSLIHARAMSVINTPPQDRLPIKTILAENDDSLIENAILRELAREGQVFFIHNRVETIFGRAEYIQKLVPHVKIVVVHGQMSSDGIDTLFHQFKNKEADILFSTTIVENGVDVPNANTILIDRADSFGMADLYQLRGRVGRWNRAAYAYFLTPKNQRLHEVARKRLHALIESGGYGGGMKIAMRDLEIRGAGDILGTQQSGQVSAIGFHLYCKLLKRTVDSMRKNAIAIFTETKVEAPFDARIPEEYIFEPSLRMELYHRFGEAASFEEVDEILQEMQDRFGPPPNAVLWLECLTNLRIFGSKNSFQLLRITPHFLYAEQKRKNKVIDHSIPLRPLNTPEMTQEFVCKNLESHFRLKEKI